MPKCKIKQKAQNTLCLSADQKNVLTRIAVRRAHSHRHTHTFLFTPFLEKCCLTARRRKGKENDHSVVPCTVMPSFWFSLSENCGTSTSSCSLSDWVSLSIEKIEKNWNFILSVCFSSNYSILKKIRVQIFSEFFWKILITLVT